MNEHRIFDTLVNGELTEVWQRVETHQLGKDNGLIDNWWAKVKRGDEFEWVPYINLGVNRPCWGVNARTGNVTKEKWGQTSLRTSGAVDITCNGRVVYSFCATDIHFGLTRAQHLIYEMGEHPFNFADPELEIDRKIWYKRQPAVVNDLSLDLGSIGIRYDGPPRVFNMGWGNKTGGFDMLHPWDTAEDAELNDWHGDMVIRDDVLSPDIWWFRE